MTIIALLDKLQTHAFDMIKFGEAKNTVLIALNGAVIICMANVAAHTNNDLVCYYCLFAVLMSAIAVFLCLAALVARIKDEPSEMVLLKKDNPLFFATVAKMTAEALLEKIMDEYKCATENGNYEKDLARQVISTSQIAARKFKLFNVAMGFTLFGVATPVGFIIYQLFFGFKVK